MITQRISEEAHSRDEPHFEMEPPVPRVRYILENDDTGYGYARESSAVDPCQSRVPPLIELHARGECSQRRERDPRV